MNPTIFSVAALKCYEQLSSFSSDPREHFFLLKMLSFASMFESEDDDELSKMAIRGFESMSKRQSKFIVDLRNSEPFCNLDLKQEKFIYSTLRKILSFESK